MSLQRKWAKKPPRSWEKRGGGKRGDRASVMVAHEATPSPQRDAVPCWEDASERGMKAATRARRRARDAASGRAAQGGPSRAPAVGSGNSKGGQREPGAFPG